MQVPTLRRHTETMCTEINERSMRVARCSQCVLVRINPESPHPDTATEPSFTDNMISVPMGALKALKRLDRCLTGLLGAEGPLKRRRER